MDIEAVSLILHMRPANERRRYKCNVISHRLGARTKWSLEAGVILYMRPANERRRYNVTSSLIGWAHTHNKMIRGSRPLHTKSCYRVEIESPRCLWNKQVTVVIMVIFRDNRWFVSVTTILPRVGVTKPISTIPLFSHFLYIFKTHVIYWMSRLYLTGVAAAQLRGHPSKINLIRRI